MPKIASSKEINKTTNVQHVVTKLSHNESGKNLGENKYPQSSSLSEEELENITEEENNRQLEKHQKKEIDPIGNWDDFTPKLFKSRKPIDFIYEDLIPKGLPGGLFAAGGTGKTFFCLQLVIYGAAGLPFGPLTPTRPLNCVYFCAEDQERFLLDRVEAIIRSDPELDKKFELIKQGFDVKSLAGVDARFLEAQHQNVERTSFFQLIIERLKEKKDLDLVIFDPLVSFWGLPENESANGQGMIQCLTKLSIETGASVMVVHHVSKESTIETISKGGGRGTSAIYDGLRWAFGMYKVPERVANKKRDVLNDELKKLRNMVGDNKAMFVKFFSAKNNHAKELASVTTFKRGKGGVLEVVREIEDFAILAKRDILEFLQEHESEFTKSELCDQVKGRNFRDNLQKKFGLTKKSIENMVNNLIENGNIQTTKISTRTKSKEVLQVVNSL